MNQNSSAQLSRPPYNPWNSYLVEASAGSGKTWQLSRRFLALVVAGADPSTILTVTFTRKAAAEMRERIIADAVRLGSGHPEFVGFIDAIRDWQPEELRSSISLRSAEEASRLIIEKTQTLKITTIDALFMQWVQQFPLETALAREGAQGSVTLQSPWDLLSNLAQQRLEQRAWNSVLSMADDHSDNRELMQSISVHAPNGSIKQLNRAIAPIMSSDTFLWSVSLATGKKPAKFYQTSESVLSDVGFINQYRQLFSDVINLVTNAEKKMTALACLANNDFLGLVKCQIVNTKRDSLSGTTFRSAAAKQNESFIQLSKALDAWDTDAKLISLNNTAQLLWSLYHAKESALHRLKAQESKGSFSDAVKGVSLLATAEQAIGARAMAWSHIRHLMLDEFQDTSRLQWMIFERLAKDLLSGGTHPGTPSSVFIVGDKKQSIYRFREADPALMDEAKASLSPLGLVATDMSESYRSSSVILDMVNEVFADHSMIQDFPAHRPAVVKIKASPQRASYGSVTIYPEADASADNGKSFSAAQNQAKQIASHIRRATQGELEFKVFDEETKSWRTPVYSDFVVLYPKKTNAHYIEEELRALAIPCQKEERHGFFDRPEIVDLRAFVTWLTWPADSMALCTVLRSPIFNLSDKELQVLLASGALVLMAKLKTNHPEIFGQLIKLRSLHRLETMSNIIGYLLTTHKITERYEFAFGPVEGPLARANILKWFDMVRSKSAEEALDAQSWALAMDDAAEEDETGNAALAANAVSLMTIHKSKGLEFPCVIVTDLASDWHKPDSGWVKDTRPGREGLWYIGTEKTRPRSSPMLKELLAINEADSRFEKARLLYVALTRASTHLVITGAKPKKPSEEAYYHQVAAAAKNLAEMIPRTINDDGIMYTRGQIDETITPDKPEETAQTIINSEPTVFESRPALLILNPSKKSWIDAPDSVPTNAGESKSALLADPQPFSPELGQAFGTLVHKLIENHILKISWSDRRLLRLIPTSLSPDHDLDFNEFLQIAKSDVANLLQSSTWQQLLADAKDLFTEIPLAGIIGEDFINAKADLILRDHDGNITVVDFKTIALKSNPSDDAQLKSLCRDLGYTEQVSQYCQLAQAAFKAPRSRGLVLFTRNRQMIEMCVHALQVP